MNKREDISWFLYPVVAHFTIRTHGVNKVFRICLDRMCRQIRKKIEFDDSLDVTKCLQHIEMTDLLHVCE